MSGAEPCTGSNSPTQRVGRVLVSGWRLALAARPSPRPTPLRDRTEDRRTGCRSGRRRTGRVRDEVIGGGIRVLVANVDFGMLGLDRGRRPRATTRRHKPARSSCGPSVRRLDRLARRGRTRIGRTARWPHGCSRSPRSRRRPCATPPRSKRLRCSRERSRRQVRERTEVHVEVELAPEPRRMPRSRTPSGTRGRRSRRTAARRTHGSPSGLCVRR